MLRDVKLYSNLVFTNKIKIDDISDDLKNDVINYISKIDPNFFNLPEIDESVISEEDIKNTIDPYKEINGN